MADLAADPLVAGRAALGAGDWTAARAAFEAAVAADDPPVARDGLARARWWIEGPARAIAERTHAYAGYHRGGDQLAAAHVALCRALGPYMSCRSFCSPQQDGDTKCVE